MVRTRPHRPRGMLRPAVKRADGPGSSAPHRSPHRPSPATPPTARRRTDSRRLHGCTLTAAGKPSPGRSSLRHQGLEPPRAKSRLTVVTAPWRQRGRAGAAVLLSSLYEPLSGLLLGVQLRPRETDLLLDERAGDHLVPAKERLTLHDYALIALQRGGNLLSAYGGRRRRVGDSRGVEHTGQPQNGGGCNPRERS
jgi:hypothetical protein